MKVPITMQLGPKYFGATVGYSLLHLDRSEFAPFTMDKVIETSQGNFAITDGIEVPDEGGYVVVLEADGVTEIREAPIEPAPLMYPRQPGVPPPLKVPGIEFIIVRGDIFMREFTIMDILPTDVVTFTMKRTVDAQCWFDLEDWQGTMLTQSALGTRPGLNVLNAVDVHTARFWESQVMADINKVSLVIEPTASKEIEPGDYVFDFQRWRGMEQYKTMMWGNCRVAADVTREIYGNA